MRLTRPVFFLVVAFSLHGCAGLKTFDEYSTSSSRPETIESDGGCYNVWKHPGGDQSIVVRQCEGSKMGHAVAEGVIMAVSLGLIRTDVGATPKEFIRAAKKYLGNQCLIANSERLDDGMGGTLGYEIIYDCKTSSST